MEHFYTIQGEGAYTGHAAYFIRLGGCDVGCHWCDVKDSWTMEGHTQMTVNELVDLVKSTPAKIVVITGGEPLMHDLTALTKKLKEAGLRTHIETSGAHPLSGTWDWICLSPKKFKEPLPVFFDIAHELKIIVFNTSDFLYAELNKSKIKNQKSKIYLQPEWSKRDEMMPLIVDFVKLHPEWQISLQTHKYLNIP
ncbi:MAG: 7-carboxy-7-deazaguanine synthase QueE [Bacteroidota bacterium]|nr:7-carboxy-7-deazaguanine synthase QueE [Bacteroidota bacterium]